MNFVNFILWLSSGAVFGWLTSRMMESERKISKVKINSNDRDE